MVGGTSTEQELLDAELPMSMPAMRGSRLGCSMVIGGAGISGSEGLLGASAEAAASPFIKLGLPVSLIDQAHLSTFWPWRPWQGHSGQWEPA